MFPYVIRCPESCVCDVSFGDAIAVFSRILAFRGMSQEATFICIHVSKSPFYTASSNSGTAGISRHTDKRFFFLTPRGLMVGSFCTAIVSGVSIPMHARWLQAPSCYLFTLNRSTPLEVLVLIALVFRRGSVFLDLICIHQRQRVLGRIILYAIRSTPYAASWLH